MAQLTSSQREEAARFEDSVRDVARLLWPRARTSGAESSSGREHDGLFRTEEAIHAIEATTSRQMQKAEDDADKLAKLLTSIRRTHQDLALKGWVVTLAEPTADQRAAVMKVSAKHQLPISIVSYKTFHDKLINTNEYLDARYAAPFGSIEDPDTGQSHDTGPYVPTDLMTVEIVQRHFGPTEHFWTIDQIAQALWDSAPDSVARFVLVGDYGAGKSTALRECFRRLADKCTGSGVKRLPIAINLRDHHGQTDPVECIERHARRVGFSNPHHLVRAWRADRVALLLDGFDEMLPATLTPIRELRALRRDATGLIRELMRESPPATPILLTGRQHFFDYADELCDTLSCTRGTTFVTLNEFSIEQVKRFLGSRGWSEALPDWLPRRPLLLGYLATRGILQDCLTTESATSGAAQGWNGLISSICERESRVPRSVSGHTIRELLERLATVARSTREGLGPLAPDHIRQAFRDVAGYEPDEKAMVLLQRLPGLVVAAGPTSGRSFVDADYADALRAGDVLRFVQDPYHGEHLNVPQWMCGLGRLGVELVAKRLEDAAVEPKQLGMALNRAAALPDGGSLASELLQVFAWLGWSYEGEPITIRSATVEQMSFSDESPRFSGIRFVDCIVGSIEFDGPILEDEVPIFEACVIGRVVGRVGEADLPRNLRHCDIALFASETSTTSGILRMNVAPGVKVLLTVLRKLFLQAGKGRRESAFFRGLESEERYYVAEVLKLIDRFGFATPPTTGDVWHPDRSMGVRVRRMIAAPSRSRESIMEAAERL